jgi:hypothetical protein
VEALLVQRLIDEPTTLEDELFGVLDANHAPKEGAAGAYCFFERQIDVDNQLPPPAAQMSTGAVVAIGAVSGLALGILVSLTTDVPLAPEAGLVLGALVGWLSRRRARSG